MKQYNPDANCIGQDPRLFDLPAHFPDALYTCEPCTARLWCLQWVNPASNHYDGVVGGHVWSNGRPVKSATTNSDPVLRKYLTTVHHKVETVAKYRHDAAPPDLEVVAGFIAGSIAWHILTNEERRIAATELLNAGHSTRHVAERCHLSGRTVAAIVEAMT